MKTLRPLLSSGLAGLVLLAAPAWAQQDPHIGYVYPAGAQRGAQVLVKVGGQRLDGASAATVSGDGVRAVVVDYRAPLRGKKLQQVRMALQKFRKQQQELRKRQQELRKQQRGRANGPQGRRGRRGKQGKGERRPGLRKGRLIDSPEVLALAEELGLDKTDLERFVEFQRKRGDPLAQFNPQLSEVVTVRLEVSADAAPGERELRLLTTRGVSNPLVIQIGQYPEVNEGSQAASGSIEVLPTVINGQILPGEIDRFRFKATKGTRLIAAVAARELIPYLADAVPGWFQATLTLLDASGSEVAYTDDFRFHPDPVISYEVPRDGEYVLEIQDAIYRGREDFVYRITLGEVPYVTSIFPLGGRAGDKTTVRVRGWNLPERSLALTPQAPGTVPVSVREREQVSNSTPFAVDSLREVREKEPNGSARRAQAVKLPLVINGRVGRSGDWDVYRFKGREGQVLVAEVQARRLNSPLDSLLKLTNEAGALLEANDDHEDKGSGLITHQADSKLRFVLPTDGAYFVHVGDTQQKGGDAYAYRLRISEARPGFTLRVVPSTLNVRRGLTQPITVYALRRDGFSGPISLGLDDAPVGFVLSGGRIPAGQDSVRATLTITPAAGSDPVHLRLEGRAKVAGAEVTRAAVPAEDMMQAFLYRHLVPSRDWVVKVLGKGRPQRAGGRQGQRGKKRGKQRRLPPPVRILGRVPTALSPGEAAVVKVAVPGGPLLRQVILELSEPPRGVTLEGFEVEGRILSVKLQVAKDAKLGLQGNLIINAFLEREFGKGKKKKKRRVPLGTLPAMQFEVVAPGTKTTAPRAKTTAAPATKRWYGIGRD